ncbi:MAG: response regulator, partial [Planctomycetes bacterium]|nr:response regulator [Planctomycetota bacterium]
MAQKHFRVLVVEKDPQIRQQSLDVLSEAGLFCEIADNGQQAMEMFEIEKYDAVVCDLRIRNGKGHSFCLDVLEHKDRPATFVTTEEIQPKIVDALKSRGAADICVKPVDFANLATKINDLLNRTDQAEKDSPSNLQDSEPLEEPQAQNTDQEQDSGDGETITNDMGGVVSQSKRIVTIMMGSPERSAELSQKLAQNDVEPITAKSSEKLYQILNQ